MVAAVAESFRNDRREEVTAFEAITNLRGNKRRLRTPRKEELGFWMLRQAKSRAAEILWRFSLSNPSTGTGSPLKPDFGLSGYVQRSDPLIHPSQKRLGSLEGSPPLRVVGSGGLGSDHFLQGPALLLELGNFLARLDEHITKQCEVGFPRDRTMAARFASAARIWPSMLPPVE